MTRQEFLQELQFALQGQLSQTAVNENIRYYDNYIIEEMQRGSSEEEVIERVGNPSLIAKTLIDTTEQFGRTAEGGFQSESYRNEESGGGFHADYSQDRGWDIRVGGFKLNSWYGKLLMVAAAVLVIVVVANVVAFLLPILVPIIVILLICSLFFGSRR